MESEVTLVVFPKLYKECAQILAGQVNEETGESEGDVFIKVYGKLERSDRGDQVICTSVEALELNERTNRPKILELMMSSRMLSRGRMEQLGAILSRYNGLDNVELLVEGASGDTMRMALPTKVDAHNMVLRAEVTDLLGKGGQVVLA